MAPITFAHRGARANRPENTLPAFSYALELGARGLETDAWLAADGEVVLVHDRWRWSRLGGFLPWRRRVDRTPSAQLAADDVPRLGDLYRTQGSDYELSIDLKGVEVGEAILKVARAEGDPSRLWLCACGVAELEALRALDPDVGLVHSQQRSKLRDGVERHAATLAEAHIDVMNLHYSEWTTGLVTLFHRFGVQAFAWDVQEVRHLQDMLRMGVDGLYCDHVARMVDTVAAWSRD